jgi:hypothetical protein
MSGGHWEFVQHKISEGLAWIAEDHVVIERWPLTAQLFHALNAAITDIVHDMDWDICGDEPIEDDDMFDRRAFNSVSALVNKVPQESAAKAITTIEGRIKQVSRRLNELAAQTFTAHSGDVNDQPQ